MRFSSRKILTVILSLSVLARVLAAILLGDQVVVLPGTADQLSYHTLALRLLGGYGFSFGQGWWPVTAAGAPTAHWSFLYTFFLTGVYALFGPHPLAARIIQAVIVGLLQPYLTYRLGERMFSRTVGLVGAACAALYAYFIYYAATLMTEPFFITAVLGMLFAAVMLVDRLKETAGWNFRTIATAGLVLGLVTGAAVLLRQLILMFVPVLFAWAAWAAYRSGVLRRALVSLAVSTGVLALMILPFSVYNTARFGHFVLLNTNSGYAFFWANHPFYGTRFTPILTDEQYLAMIPTELKTLDEAALDQALLRRGLAYVTTHPREYALLSLSRIPVYFMFWPSSDSGLASNLTRVASFGLFWPFMLAGLLLALFRRSQNLAGSLASPIFLVVLFSAVYTAVHLLSWTLIRYRLPVDAVLLIFAGLALVELYRLVETLGLRWKKA